MSHKMVRPRALSPLAALAAAMMAGHVAAVMPTAFIRMTSSAGSVFAAPAVRTPAPYMIAD